MTDEEKAEKYFEDSKDYYDSREPITDRQLRQIYLDGLAEGRKEKCLEQNNDGTIRPCEVMKENEELKEQLQNNPYVQILQNEKAEMAEDFAKQIEKITSILWWESHTDDDKLRNIWKVLLPKEKYVRD